MGFEPMTVELHWDLIKEVLPTEPQHRGAEVIFHASEDFKEFDISEDNCFSVKQNFRCFRSNFTKLTDRNLGTSDRANKNKTEKFGLGFRFKTFLRLGPKPKKIGSRFGHFEPERECLLWRRDFHVDRETSGGRDGASLDGSDRIPIRPFTMIAQDDLTH